MIHVIRNGKIPANQGTFPNRFHQKVLKNCSRLEAINNVLYRKFSDHICKVKCEQIVVSDNINDEIIQTLDIMKLTPFRDTPAHQNVSQELRKQFYTFKSARKVQSYNSLILRGLSRKRTVAIDSRRANLPPARTLWRRRGNQVGRWITPM